MIARIWKGATSAEHYEEYSKYLRKKVMPDHEKTTGFLELTFMRSLEGDKGHFTLITFWESLDAIKQFAGEDYQKAKFYPKDKEYLLEYEDEVTHQEVFAI